jgi:diguanylate cyclase (GGDEF)-like protein
MTLDVPTLMLAGSFVAAMCAAFLLFSWWQHRETSAALWWAGGHLTLGLGVMSLAVGFVGNAAPLFGIGLTLIVVAPALIWSGVRAFHRQPIPYLLIAAGPVIWLAAFASLALHGQAWTLPLVNTMIAIAYNAAAIAELARRSGLLRAGVPLMALMAVHIAALSMAVPDALAGRMSILEPPALASLFGLIHFETIVYLIGTTVFFVAMMKEQSELRQRQDAETDALTGLPNRGAFLAVAERLAARSRRDRRPLAVAAFDLDRFKQVNDTYGHALGDRTLQVFAEVARESLRPGDLVSRIGGEEFAAVFPGADREVAYLMSERIRRAFAVAALAVNGRELGATVSAGVAVAVDAETLAEVMERADAALYRAKLNGRDRVECDGGPPRAYPRLVEVA